MTERRALRGFPLAGVALSGVVLGHWLTYLFAIPEPHVRAEILAASGHSYWLLAIKCAVVLGLTALGTVFLRHLGGALRREHRGPERFSSVVVRLSVLQVVAFMAMEIAERLAAGAPVAEMFQHHLLFLGLAVQVLVAFAGALVLLWFGRAAARIPTRSWRLNVERFRRPPYEPSGCGDSVG